VSDGNPYSEALFRTMKYRPEYPSGAFETIGQAQAWADDFVRWYTFHLYSAIRFVTPDNLPYGGKNSSWPTGGRCMKKLDAGTQAGGRGIHETGIQCRWCGSIPMIKI
jgi:hypothetical protein